MTEKKIIRTFTRLEVCATLYDKANGQIEEQNFVIDGNPGNLLAAVREELESNVLTVVDAKPVRKISAKYVISAEDFLKYATPVNNENTKEGTE